MSGASRGIGAAMAKELARAGAHVVLLARTVGALEQLDDEISAEGGSATLIPVDLQQFDKIDTLGPVLAEKFGKLDIFVGNAGLTGTFGPLTHMKEKEWQRVMDVNLNANFRLIRTLDPLLQASDAGRALFVTSARARTFDAYKGAYTVSKAALEALVNVYAAETVKTNLRVNLVCPTATDTAMLAQAYPGGYQGEILKPEQIAREMLYLVSPAFTGHGDYIDLHKEEERKYA